MITGKDNIELYRLITLKYALKLELKGMKRKGRTAYSLIKQEFNLKGNKQKVYDQFTTIIKTRSNKWKDIAY